MNPAVVDACFRQLSSNGQLGGELFQQIKKCFQHLLQLFSVPET